jgi:hypothetical protein
MRPPDDLIDNVEIVEPPLQDITHKGSFLKRACLSGCLFLLIIAALIIALVCAILGSRSKSISKLPSYFPASIPAYDRDNISEITLESDRYKTRKKELSEALDKFLSNPLNLASRNKNEPNFIQKIWSTINTPKEQYPNTIVIEWKNINAEPKFVYSYFKNQLQKNGYEFKNEDANEEKPFFEFNKDYINGTFTAQKSTDDKKTAWLKITVTLPYLEETENNPPNQNEANTNFNPSTNETSSPSI